MRRRRAWCAPAGCVRELGDGRARKVARAARSCGRWETVGFGLDATPLWSAVSYRVALVWLRVCAVSRMGTMTRRRRESDCMLTRRPFFRTRTRKELKTKLGRLNLSLSHTTRHEDWARAHRTTEHDTIYTLARNNGAINQYPPNERREIRHGETIRHERPAATRIDHRSRRTQHSHTPQSAHPSHVAPPVCSPPSPATPQLEAPVRSAGPRWDDHGRGARAPSRRQPAHQHRQPTMPRLPTPRPSRLTRAPPRRDIPRRDGTERPGCTRSRRRRWTLTPRTCRGCSRPPPRQTHSMGAR
jgi:hypothetical protein